MPARISALALPAIQLHSVLVTLDSAALTTGWLSRNRSLVLSRVTSSKSAQAAEQV
jgi:hypothetical protein